jgi:uncharacterized protein YukE
MLSRHITLRLVAALSLFGFSVVGAEAFPSVHAQGNKNKTKPVDPLTTAIKDLQDAQKAVESKDNTSASQKTHNADSIVANADTVAKQTRDRLIENGAPKDQRDQIKARVTALNDVLKDIHTAEKNIAAKKTDDAVTALKSAIAGLEGLTGSGGEKKKK